MIGDKLTLLNPSNNFHIHINVNFFFSVASEASARQPAKFIITHALMHRSRNEV